MLTIPIFLFCRGLPAYLFAYGFESQSKAFLTMAEKDPLYSGVEIKMPDDFRTIYCKSNTAFGISKLIGNYFLHITDLRSSKVESLSPECGNEFFRNTSAL